MEVPYRLTTPVLGSLGRSWKEVQFLIRRFEIFFSGHM